ncbi:hydroxyacylglutathione hydrolase [Fusarium heterosporum]|uniref:Hydroxyacylglutathione hydrolase n=1 Tax=Fusarium heterosporum TaxID=42747 RepID=A0A8H5TIB8_FUSHE|nr:hydroxyacylglutathione hydrolase [Fusarium heterosporum]
MSSTHFRIAIVGGGISGLASLHGLVEAIQSNVRPVSVTVFEPSGEVGPGLAYRTDQPYCWLLNHEANHLGTLNGGHDGFLNWMKAHRETLSQEYAQALERGWVPADAVDGLIKVDSDAYYPRSLFGRFLRYAFKSVKKEAQIKGIHVTVVKRAIHAMDEHSEGKIILHDDIGENYIFEQTVLCTGHTYSIPDPVLACRDTYVSNLYERKQRRSVITTPKSMDGPKNLGRVAVRGTGMSGNDAILWLLEQRELGLINFDEILMVSRRGLLRKTRTRIGDFQFKFLTMDSLEARVQAHGHVSLDWLLPQVRNEMESAYGVDTLDWEDIWNPRTADIGKHLEQSIRESTSGQVSPWRSVMNAFATVRQYIYEHMPDDDKLRFFQELASLFYSYQAPMPTVSAIRIHDAIKSGILKPEAGLSNIELDEVTGNYTLTFCTGKDGRPVLTHGRDHVVTEIATKRLVEVDYLIDAMGQTRNFQHLRNPYPQLFAAKLLRAYPWGGIQIDPNSRQLIKANGQRCDNVWQLGINSLGDIFITVNAPRGVADGLEIGRGMVKQLNNRQREHHLPLNKISVPATLRCLSEWWMEIKHTFLARRIRYTEVRIVS